MTLGEQRKLFTKLLAQLITWAFAQGYEVSLNEVMRTQAQADQNATSGTGIKNSLHLLGLAADLNLFIAGVYQTTSDAHKPLGAYWKSLHPLARWGGDFKPSPDGNHYSLEYKGVK